MISPFRYMFLCLSIMLGLFILAANSGCGSGGKEDDTESTSSANTEITQNDCSGSQFEILVPESQVEDLLADAEENGDEVVSVEDVGEIPSNQGGLDQQTRHYLVKLLIVAGCGNNVQANDDHSVVDTDTVTSVGVPAE